MPCPRCHATAPPGSQFCPNCGTSLGGSVLTMTAGEAGLDPSTPDAPTRAPASDSGWLTSSASIDHGRFGPGTILDNRYRVLGLLGRGGMGEVYRADDLRLGQQVALKFLPPSLSRDPGRLAQFHNEVRTARQVSHPNVCRVYDIGEIDGQLFITMEYVDGEDLSVLLRRIGRVPEDKGIDIARQICAGLAAAHERGVLHRDLKPANIMLDGSGRVRLMDFSLAAVGTVSDVRAGTPAYMAPEQLGGQEVTVRSDIYALGLVLYEVFTGRRAYDAKNLAELLEQHQSGTLTAPTTIVTTLDPAIERAIVRCLDPAPSRRPPSAIAVSASLPGGDPLAAALAAGETPSPEMVAAAGGDRAALGVAAGAAWLAIVTAGVLAAAVLSSRYALIPRVPLMKPAAVLADRAEQIREAIGYTDTPIDRAWGFDSDGSYLSWAEQHGSGTSGWAELATGRPAAMQFWYRTSPELLVPVNPLRPVSSTDPPGRVDGMIGMIVDTDGRLLHFEAAPPQIESASAAATPMDWRKLFSAAGLDIAAFTETSPNETPATYADERKAWKGTLPQTVVPVTIEAAAYRGRPVLFDIVGPWTKPARAPQANRVGGVNPNWIYISALLAVASFAAYRNLRRGRADRRGAFRLAAFMTALLSASWIVMRHVGDGAQEQQRLFVQIGVALFIGGAMYIVYLAFEPVVRRLWPSMLVGWSRVLGGRIRDPLIGRDALVGVACGAVLALLALMESVIPALVGQPQPAPRLTELGGLMGMRGAVATLISSLSNGVQSGLLTVFEYSFFRAVFEWVTRTPLGARRWTIAATLHLDERASDRVFVALSVLVAGAFAIGATGSAIDRYMPVAYEMTTTLLILVVLLRIGIFASIVMFFTNSLLLRMPMTFDSSAVFAGGTWLALAVLFAIAVLGFRMATSQLQKDRLPAVA